MRRRLFSAASLLAMLAPHLMAQAQTPEAPPAELPEQSLQGQARMRFFGLHIYDIRLWAREPVNAQNWSSKTLALELIYARSLNGREIAKRSLAEMRRQGEIAAPLAQRWLADMEAAFPDVKAGDRISGLFEPGRGVQFFYNGQARPRIQDPDFARLFAGIWLAEQSSEPAMRSRLLEGAGAPR